MQQSNFQAIIVVALIGAIAFPMIFSDNSAALFGSIVLFGSIIVGGLFFSMASEKKAEREFNALIVEIISKIHAKDKSFAFDARLLKTHVRRGTLARKVLTLIERIETSMSTVSMSSARRLFVSVVQLY